MTDIRPSAVRGTGAWYPQKLTSLSRESPAAPAGTETAQKHANVPAPFTAFRPGWPRKFRYLGPGVLVRDEGVAGSNPATPTKQNKHLENRRNSGRQLRRQIGQGLPRFSCPVFRITRVLRSSPSASRSITRISITILRTRGSGQRCCASNWRRFDRTRDWGAGMTSRSGCTHRRCIRLRSHPSVLQRFCPG